MATANDKNVGVQILGIRSKDLLEIPLIANPKIGIGDISNFRAGIALGSGIARELQVIPGDTIKLISPNGLKTVFGTIPKVEIFEVIYIFEVGRYDIDNTRIYMPLGQAQIYFNKSNGVDEIEVFVSEPDNIDEVVIELKSLVNPGSLFWTWKDRSGAFLNALKVEDNVMFVILSILVLIASLNIVSGLIMLVKNKGRDIGILRTIGLTQSSILRIFFICGALVGVLGTICGVFIGCIFILNIDPIFNIISDLRGADIWDPSVRYLSKLPARLELSDILLASSLSITLSFVVTFFPARRASKLNPVEALRDE
jgi:lipoprotein-releasing system permease protein